MYVLKNQDSEIYIGSTNNLKKRINQHNKGLNKSTKGKAWSLETCIAVKRRLTARRLEKYLKSGSGRATLKKRLFGEGTSIS